MGTVSQRAGALPAWGEAAQAMYRAAQAAAHPGGASLMGDLVRALTDGLDVPTAFVAVFSDESRRTMRTLAAVLDGVALPNFDYALAGTPCEAVVGHAFRYVARGVARELQPDTLFAAKGMDAYAAFPLNDRDGRPLGLLVAMDRRPIADAALAEALLKIFAGRIVAEIERERADAELRAAALAVSHARGESVFAELARYLATVLHVEVAFVSRQDRKDPRLLRMLALHIDGRGSAEPVSYPLQGTPCEGVYGGRFRAYASGLRERFPDDEAALLPGLDSYAGQPLNDSSGAPLGVIAVASRRPLTQLDRIESMLQIFAVRAAAELEQLRATEALRRSEASYRAIFEAAEDAIFIHDWDSGAIVDANPRACANYGYSRDELLRLSVGELSSGEEPYTQQQALRRLALAKLDRCPPFEWQRRSRDGRLGWDELHLKPLQIDGRPHILAIAREVTERKAALAALQASEQQYRAIFDGSADAMGLWDSELRLVDVNHAFTRLSGWSRDEVIGRPLSAREGEPEVAQRSALIRGALGGIEGRIETRVPGRDGQLFEVEVRYVPVRFGGVAYALSVARDITERNAALRALRAQEQKYRAMFDSTVDAIVLWSSELRVVDVNDAFVQMTGLPREQVIGRHWSERPDADDLGRLLELIEGALQGRVMQATQNVARADGSRFEIEVRYLPVRLGDENFALGVGRDVSDRLERERRLRDSEAQYRAIFDASADALMLWNSRLERVDVNPAHERIFGYPRDEVIGRAFEGLGYPEAMVQPRLDMLRRALAGESCRAELEAQRKDGQRIVTELRSMPVLWRGEPHVLQVARDVTERRTAEARLQASEQQYREIFNASVDALVLWNSRYQRVDVNRAYERIFGWTRDEVVGHAYDVPRYPDAYVAPRRELVRRALDGEACSAELQALRKNGEQLLIEVHAIPFQHQGEAHVLAIVRDITETRAAADALAMREQQYRAIFEGSTDSLVLWDDQLRFVDVNPTYTRLYGFTRDEVVGSGIDQRLPPGLVEERSACIRAALSGEQRVIETSALRKDGRSFEIELRYLPIVHLGTPHVLAIGRDITERRAAEAERARLEAQLRQAQKMEAIGQLTGGIAHDFNNILTSVIGYLVLGQERAERLADAPLQRQLGQAQLAAQRARDLIAQMLAFARRQRGERRVLALVPLVQQTLQLLRATLPASVAVDVQTGGGDARALQVLADPVQLEQVLFNLCINARDAIDGPGLIRVRLGEAGGGWTCASCRVHVSRGRWLEIGVADDGAGIAPPVLERMFEPFFTTKEVGRGSGMGLAMVHGIVHDHGGHIEVQTRVGAGARFRVLLPPARGADEGAAAVVPAAPAAAAHALAGRVMVVDDEPMVGDFMAELLGGWGLEVVLQREPRAALAWLREGTALDLLITDQTMPQMSGLVLAREARALRPALPVLLYSGNADAADAAERERHGIWATLSKPVDAEALRALVQEALGGAGPALPHGS